MSLVKMYCPHCKKQILAKASRSGFKGPKVFICTRCGKRV